jgi:hypothetical protein
VERVAMGVVVSVLDVVQHVEWRTAYQIVIVIVVVVTLIDQKKMMILKRGKDYQC